MTGAYAGGAGGQSIISRGSGACKVGVQEAPKWMTAALSGYEARCESSC